MQLFHIENFYLRYLQRSKRMEIQIYLQRVAQDIGISDLTSYDLAEALDDADPLKFLRNEFAYPKMKTLPHGQLIAFY